MEMKKKVPSGILAGSVSCKPSKATRVVYDCALSAASTSQVMEHVIVETDIRVRERTDGGRTTDARRVIDVIFFPRGGGRAEWIGEWRASVKESSFRC